MNYLTENLQVWFKNRRAKDRKQKREADIKDNSSIKITASDESDYDVSDDDERSSVTKAKKQRIASRKSEVKKETKT